jgi:ubiquitin carboxyl-terminal hydrolase 22/27/51
MSLLYLSVIQASLFLTYRTSLFCYPIADVSERYKIAAPVGIYNLGNTCFKSAILQCLVHCKPLQEYFLKDTGHHHKSCIAYRRRLQGKKKKGNAAAIPGLPKGGAVDSVCLACEMDSLFLGYYGSSIGKDVVAALEEASHTSQGRDNMEEIPLFDELERGDPLVLSNLLTSAWKSGGMKNLAGYEQRDAHEFLNSFLDMMGKHSRQYRERVHAFVNSICDNNSVLSDSQTGNGTSCCAALHAAVVLTTIVLTEFSFHADIIKELFEGTLRSVLVCEKCGGKRMLHEAFMNISLTLSDEVERRQSQGVGGNEISVETCLEHFILAEKLGDPVHCPSCATKTPTKKQHTFSKLPKVLCLHLKRFDAAKNRKINEFVSFPARDLNMGTLLSHW